MEQSRCCWNICLRYLPRRMRPIGSNAWGPPSDRCLMLQAAHSSLCTYLLAFPGIFLQIFNISRASPCQFSLTPSLGGWPTSAVKYHAAHAICGLMLIAPSLLVLARWIYVAPDSSLAIVPPRSVPRVIIHRPMTRLHASGQKRTVTMTGSRTRGTRTRRSYSTKGTRCEGYIYFQCFE